mmetsp:Transcript_139126/g.242079  ORF Transcript_139126/g.242079 Transcript_139126/m.242079 type:complete len:97 (+) Transcript_139126:539-829(+)
MVSRQAMNKLPGTAHATWRSVQAFPIGTVSGSLRHFAAETGEAASAPEKRISPQRTLSPSIDAAAEVVKTTHQHGSQQSDSWRDLYSILQQCSRVT